MALKLRIAALPNAKPIERNELWKGWRQGWTHLERLREPSGTHIQRNVVRSPLDIPHERAPDFLSASLNRFCQSPTVAVQGQMLKAERDTVVWKEAWLTGLKLSCCRQDVSIFCANARSLFGVCGEAVKRKIHNVLQFREKIQLDKVYKIIEVSCT